MGDERLVLGDARQLDQSAAGQFDADEHGDADGDDDDRPEQAVDDVGLRVQLVVDSVVHRLRVVEAAERPADRVARHVPVDLGRALRPSLATHRQRTLQHTVHRPSSK